MTRGGLYVVFEGIDGGGKTTLIRGVREALMQQGLEVVTTKEPTDGPIGRRIRALAATGREHVRPEEELAMFHEDRKLHVANVVRPELARGKTVLQDRSFYSTIAYQGDRGLDRAAILRDSLAIAEEPDVLLIIDVPPEVALERIRVSRGVTDDFETLESLERVRAAFLAFMSGERPREKHLIDGRSSPESMKKQSLTIIESVRARM